MTSVPPETWAAPERPEQDAAPDVPRPGPTGADAWPAWAAPVALLSGLAGAFVGGLIVAMIAYAFGADIDDSPPGVLLGGTLVQNVAFVVAAIVFARMTGRVTAAQFGLRPTPFWRAVGGVVLLYIAFAIFALIWAQIVGDPNDEPLLDDLGVSESTLLAVLGVLTVCVAAPLVEEFFFRGFFYRALRNSAGIAGAAVITGVVFGGMHALSSPAEHLVPLAVLGALFCLLYQFTGSLLPCIALHALNNSLAFSFDQEWGAGALPLAVGAIAVCLLIATVVGRRWGEGWSAPTPN